MRPVGKSWNLPVGGSEGIELDLLVRHLRRDILSI